MDADREQRLLRQISLLEEKAGLLEEHLRIQKMLTGGQEIELSRLRSENELLRQRLDLVLRKVFGAKSETLDPAQLELLLRDDADDAAKKASAAAGADAPPAADEPPATPAKTRAARQPRDLSRLEVREQLDIPAFVKANPDAYREISRVHTDRLDYQPEVIFIERTVRPVFLHRDDPDAVPVKAPAPPSLRPGLSVTPRLLAHLMVGKYCDHLPFHRQEGILLRRHGVNIPRHTMCRWAAIAADALEPLYKLQHAGLLAESYLQADETPVRHLVPGRGSCATGYLWVLHAPGPCGAKGDVLFQWHPDRRAANLDELLGDRFSGILQCDGYAAYDTYRNKHPGVTLAACWAHARRKFHEALKTGQALAAGPLRTIQALYRIETGLRASRAGPEERREVRQAKAIPLIEALKPALLDLRRHPQVLPKSPLGKAIDYTLALWVSAQPTPSCPVIIRTVGLLPMANTNDLLPAESPAIIRTGADGRQRYDENYKSRVLEAFDRSGMSGKAFAAQCGVKYPTFASWLAKRRGGLAGDGAASSGGPAFLLAEIADVPSGVDALEITLPGGAVARAATPAQVRLLADLVRALA